MTSKATKKSASVKTDNVQTPPYALKPLMKHIPEYVQRIWEPAAGEGLVSKTLRKEYGYHVIATDISYHEPYDRDFLGYKEIPGYNNFHMIITNPPWSLKYEFIEKCYEIGKPWALLMPLETLGAWSAQKHFKKHGMELIILRRRVHFKMPDKKWKGTPWMPVAWFTYKLHIGQDIVYENLIKEKFYDVVEGEWIES